MPEGTRATSRHSDDKTTSRNGERELGRQAGRVQQAASETAERVEEAGEQTARAGVTALHEGAESAIETQRRLADRLAEHSGRTMESVANAGAIYRDATGATGEDMTALLASASVITQGMQEMQRVWIESLQRSIQTGAKAPQSMLRCTSFQEVAQIQGNLLRENMDTLLESSTRLLRIASRIAQDAARPIEDRARR